MVGDNPVRWHLEQAPGILGQRVRSALASFVERYIRRLAQSWTRVARLQRVRELIQGTAVAVLDLDAAMRRAGNLTRLAVAADVAAIILLDEGQPIAHIWSTVDRTTRDLSLADLRLTGLMPVAGRSTLIANTADDDRAVFAMFGARRIRSLLVTSLRLHGQVLGYLAAGRRQPGFQPADASLLEAVAQQVALPVRNAQLYAVDQERARRLASLDRARREFLSATLHELRSPLTSLELSASLLEARLRPDLLTKEDRRLLLSLLRSADRLALLVDDLLELARLESGPDGLNREAVDVRALVSETAAGCGPLLSKGEHDLKLLLPPEPVIAALDRRLARALTALFEHSALCIPVGHPIRVELQVERRRLWISFDRHGEDSRDELRPHRFKPADLAAGERHGWSLTLGQAVAWLLVELHGGTLWSDCAPGLGVAIRMELPHEQPAPPATSDQDEG